MMSDTAPPFDCYEYDSLKGWSADLGWYGSFDYARYGTLVSAGRFPGSIVVWLIYQNDTGLYTLVGKPDEGPDSKIWDRFASIEAAQEWVERYLVTTFQKCVLPHLAHVGVSMDVW